MVEIRHLENWHVVIFFCWEWSDLHKISESGAEWHVDCGDVVETETICRIPICVVCANSVACHPRATCHIAGCCHRANSVACYPKATYHIAGCCHLVNSLSWLQSHMPHCRVKSPGEINVIVTIWVRYRWILFFLKNSEYTCKQILTIL